MYMLCRHIKPDGTRCEAPALLNQPYCYFHNHYRHEAGKDLKKAKTKKLPIALPRLVDRTSVLEALSDVIGALGTGHLDASTAGRLIYGLQVAGQFAQESAPRYSLKAIQSFTVAEDGAEIADEFYICEEDDRCEGCPDKETCQLDQAKEFRAARGDKPDADKEEENKDSGDDDDENDGEENED